MIKNIDQTLAQQIVDTVKDVCGQNINFIEPSGIILASTNPNRIGMFHEIGQKAASTETAIEVDANDGFTGTRHGINVPIFHNKTVLAVIGITGEPEKVRKYAYLAERITNLLIREKELNSIRRSQADIRQFIIDSLIRRENVNYDYLRNCLQSMQINTDSEKQLILIQIDSKYSPTNLSFVEQKIQQLFERMQLVLYTFHYPNEYLAVIDSKKLTDQLTTLKKFASAHSQILKIGVGRSDALYRLDQSYQSAVIACNSLVENEQNLVLFDDLTLEIVLSELSENSREAFRRKTIAPLTDEEITLLQIYFEENMSLAATSNRLFLHKNTIQYKLNHIYQQSGLNPRCFQDAVLLYLAVRLR
ncbi:CdaR family transcriptional regulator [Hespellia stercorisuis]|uniref:Carbohydrate diacid regulator n=1 Tax=Hespellia stercorisuis DSM 15480 TaxID=1121950 RepID=A0A1M6IKX3_9FIRM|nr:sugar diacid recognition domain-containing protein [Hespellia stercorisuis]SHJ35098.1 carbohydrate diacid regulator [Hespellia stercorisuis DSM 15480]